MKTLFAAILFAVSFTSSAFANVNPYRCVEIGSNQPPRTMSVRIVPVKLPPENTPFPAFVEIREANGKVLFSQAVKTKQEDVMYNFYFMANGFKLVGTIFADELDQTSVDIHVNKQMYHFRFDCGR